MDPDCVQENIIRLVETFCDFKSEQPGAYCVYSPLVTGSLKKIMGTHRLNTQAQIALFRD